MERQVTIDGKEYRMLANGATPRVYRSLFKKEVFSELTKAMAQHQDGTFELLDSEAFENLAYCMAVQGGSISVGTKIEDWLGSLSSPTAILGASQDILGLWFAETETTSTGKKE